MRPKIQVKLATEHMKYLEEQIQVLEPVITVIKQAVEKSKTWIEDKNDNSFITYIELSQELESATTAMLDAASNIINENQHHVDVEGGTPSSSQSTPKSTATETIDHSELKRNQTNILSRLEQIETAISSLQDANVKSADDISEIKQWRDNFVTEQRDMGINIERLTKNQKQNIKNLRKQMSEQDNKVKELNKEIESLKEKETKSNKRLEKLSLDMKEYENNLHKINKEMQDHTDKTDRLTQEIKRHSDLIVSLQDKNNKILVKTSTGFEKLQSKHSVMYKLLHQRLMPIDKLIQIFNQNLETRQERINKLGELENTISKLSKDFHLIESRVCNRYACHMEFVGSTPVSDGSIISTIGEVREYNGQHFNQTTGKFVSPHDGLYLVCVCLHESGDKQIVVGVVAGDRWCKTIQLRCANTSPAGSTVVDMKKGQELYLKVYQAEQGAKLSSYSCFTIVSL